MISIFFFGLTDFLLKSYPIGFQKNALKDNNLLKLDYYVV